MDDSNFIVFDFVSTERIMWMDTLENFNETNFPVSLIGGDEELVRAIQRALELHGYLDPPDDGVYGSVTNWALGAFCYNQGFSLGAGLNPQITKSLVSPSIVLPAIDISSNWVGRCVGYALGQGHWFSRHPECYNILYVEGIGTNGVLNDDKPNEFNDVRIVFRVMADGICKADVWDGTTEPGTHWTVNPMNANGAARIAFGQYKSWRVGIHNGDHEALRQVKNVTVHRDLNQDFIRTGDKTYTGLFGINQHWGYDLPKDDLGTSSAGCLVGRTKSGHRQFMKTIKDDARYAAGGTYTFMSSILPGDEIDL